MAILLDLGRSRVSLGRAENVTGLSGFAELHGKQLELLKEAVPKIARVAVSESGHPRSLFERI